ncbi:MAG: hypothetical protein Q8L71_02815 [Thiobacillus sp.]|nr:hypothetical protein [Thiobacillus sp.]
MTGKKRNPSEELERLADALVEDILNATNQEILDEAQVDYGNAKVGADEIRALFQLARTKVAKGRLETARNGLAADRAKGMGKVLPFDIAKSRQIVSKFAANDSELQGRLTMAARMGEELSDQDIQGIIEDMIKLGILTEDGSEES